ncbi:uncharacterized protein LOC143720589 [Siphateles boraxobius]|uniref:uncharacterized protein LOC143720589 n=1 Tax=Siphateles boraxobius TaxID=180520 RepID=UPI0040647746
MVTWDQIMFLIKGSHKNFDTIEEISLIRKGDLLMREISSIGPYHVGVYCGKHVIEFTAPENSKFSHQFTSCSSNSESGTVNKKSVKNFIAKKPYRVVRLRMAIPENFSALVEEAMDYDGIYHPLMNNCLHFALRLLELEPGSIPKSLPIQRDVEISMDDLEERATLTGRNNMEIN